MPSLIFTIVLAGTSAASLAVGLLIYLAVKRKADDASALAARLDALSGALDRLELSLRDEVQRSARSSREESAGQVKMLGDLIGARMTEASGAQREQLEAFSRQISNLVSTTTESLNRMTATIEGKLKDIQTDNNEKLEKMRQTVDEKLHKTLEERIGQSFKLVSERLEEVHKGLGEMQSLASGVGDLKKVLSNVKTRGILGEIQLESILEQMLSPEQYAKNIATKSGSRDVVEFALRLPGKDTDGLPVYLPIDSKFPLDVYNLLITAYESGEQAQVDEAGKQLEAAIKKCAKDIRDKYIDPPHTTDFALMFLPVEGLYAEVVRRAGLIEVLARDYRINITGPTTLAALLNSLQMGFRTLAIEKRSSEVWKILGAVKTEFMRFGDVLQSAQKRISQANEDIDSLVGTRTRQIIRRLEKINQLPQEEATAILPPQDAAQEE